MKILMVCSEIAPYVKVGGLADVVGGISTSALSSSSEIEVASLLPYYRTLREKTEWEVVEQLPLPPELFPESMGDAPSRVPLMEHRAKDEPHLFALDIPQLYDRPGVYGPTPASGYEDNAQRYALLCYAALEIVKRRHYLADLFHLHDWVAGLVPTLQRLYFKGMHVPSLLTIHNFGYTGEDEIKEQETLRSFLKLPKKRASFLLPALKEVTAITTVSPNYAKELLKSRGIFGKALSRRKSSFFGILNGIDLQVWNPATDENLDGWGFDGATLTRKSAYKEELLTSFHKKRHSSGPMVGMVTRIVEQKGFDFLLSGALKALLEDLQARKGSLVLLGSGDQNYEKKLLELSWDFPNFVFIRAYNEKLSHRIIAASDFFLIPSLFEPCGLTQLYAMRYGSVPIVHSVGGLFDTVSAYPKHKSGAGRGFTFQKMSALAFLEAVKEAFNLYDRPEEMKKLQKELMSLDFSWQSSLKKYSALYSVLGSRKKLSKKELRF